MNYSIKVNHELKIIRYSHSGLIDKKEEIGQVWEELLRLKEFTELKYNLLSDYRNATINLRFDDIGLIIDFLYSIKHILNGKKQSLVLNDPKSTAMSLLFKTEIYKKMDFNVKVFSTIGGALTWLAQ